MHVFHISSIIDKKAWNVLNEVTLAQVILFNRRSQGEVSKMTGSDFENRKQNVQNCEYGISEIEKNLCKIFQVAEIIGKRGRTVPVLLTNRMVTGLTVLLERREEVRVQKKNTFLFPCSNFGSLGHIRGSDVLRKHSEIAECLNSENMRSTKFRKHVGTCAQLLVMNENQIDC